MESPIAPEPADTDLIPLSRMRKQIAEHMVRSKATQPARAPSRRRSTFTPSTGARDRHGEAWKAKEGFSLSYLPFIALARVCRGHPRLPACQREHRGASTCAFTVASIWGSRVDLGPGGLMAPVVRDAHEMDLLALARAIRGVAAAARDGSVGPDDLAGGTYTISNSGTFGTLITAPVINQPQVAILSTDGVRKKPAASWRPRTAMRSRSGRSACSRSPSITAR